MFPSIGHGSGPGGRGNSRRRSNVLRINSSASTAVAAPMKRLVKEVMMIMVGTTASQTLVLSQPEDLGHMPV